MFWRHGDPWWISKCYIKACHQNLSFESTMLWSKFLTYNYLLTNLWFTCLMPYRWITVKIWSEFLSASFLRPLTHLETIGTKKEKKLSHTASCIHVSDVGKFLLQFDGRSLHFLLESLQQFKRYFLKKKAIFIFTEESFLYLPLCLVMFSSVKWDRSPNDAPS